VIDKQEIYGSWAVINKNDGNINYHEIFINENTMYYYDINLGLGPSSKYYIEGNTLFHSQFNSEFEKIGKIILDKDVLKIVGNNKVLLLKRVKSSKTLEKLINESIDRDEFWEAYLQRYIIWKKTSL
jgi:hypothetical protein